MSRVPQDAAGSDPALWRWELAGLLALAVIVVAIPLSLLRSEEEPPAPDLAQSQPAFVGEEACKDCHEEVYARWQGSDHDLAMAEATEETVLGDFDDATFSDAGITSRFFRRGGRFFVHTEGPGGEMRDFEITYTFGHDPLQQYLVPFPGGRLQVLNLAWDVERGRWFRLYPDRRIPPDDWLHWTRNAQNWNGMCAECHSTNLRKGFDPESDTYKTTWSDVDVGCEACHGPGSRHVAWARIAPMARPELPDAGLVVSTARISPARMVELCAPCHSRRAELGDYDHTKAELLDHMLPSLLEEGLYYPDGQILDEVYVYGSFLQSKMYARGVSCPDCHDSHSLVLHRKGNELCLQCHPREVYDDASHHFHRKVWKSEPSDGALCVKCHMVEQPYMVIDWRADHSFRVPRPDLSADLGTPNACTQSGCHDDKPLSWSIDAYRAWYGRARRPHFGTILATARAGEPGHEGELARLAGDRLQPALVRAMALDLLARSPGPEGDRALREAIDAEEPLLRRTAAANWPIAEPADVESLAPRLSDPVRAVRLAAASRLAGAPRERLAPYQREAFERVVVELREALSYTLDFAPSAFNLGNLEAALGNPARAERLYRRALAIDDLFFPAKRNLAVLLSRQGRNAEAETLLREVLRDYPDDADTTYLLGLLLAELGQPAEATDLLRRAVDTAPEHARAHRNLGLLLQRQGHLEEAERELSRAVELEPNSLDSLFALADHWFRRGRREQALALAERMIELHPEQEIGRRLRAAILRAPRASASGQQP